LSRSTFISADADHDNGVILHGAPRYGRDDERAGRRLEASPDVPFEAPWNEEPANFAQTASVLKNYLGTRIRSRSGTKYADFGPFRARIVVIISPMPTFSTRWPYIRSSQK
jgi:hypothetical protein